MPTYQVIPHNSIGPVRLGMSRDEIRSLMGKPSAVQEAHERWGIEFPDMDMFIDNAFQVEYDEAMNAVFIEVSKHDSYRIEFDGLDVHRDSLNDVICSLRRLDEPDINRVNAQ